MNRSLPLKLSGLALAVLLQVGTLSHMQHMLCMAGVYVTPAAAAPEATLDAHAHHHMGASSDAASQGEDGEHHDSSPHQGPCQLCCPHGAVQISLVDNGAALFAAAADVGVSAPAEAPALAPTAHLLPFPNAPPTA